MNTRKHYNAARAAGESFSTAAAVVTLVFDVVTGFLKNSLPGFVKWVVAAGVGLIAACFSGRNAWRAEEERERQEEAQRTQYIQLVAEVKTELDEIKRSVGSETKLKHVHGNVDKAYSRLDRIHRSVAKNDRFFRSADEKSKLLDQKYPSSEDSDDEVQLLKFKS